ncbi:MAG: AI-2E family transporter [Lentisphaerae bacterium]|nr:AI-2E family transporter [Lentisphaerota bacterium]
MIKSVTERFRKYFELPVNKAIDAVAGLFSNEDQLSGDDKHLVALLKSVLPTDQSELEKSYVQLRGSFERKALSERKIAYLMDFLRQVAPLSVEEALELLNSYGFQRRRDVLAQLLRLAIDHGEYRENAFIFIKTLAMKLEISEAEFSELSDNVLANSNNRAKILRSGTGIILALIVIGLFVLIATWLSSLLFGLALAYIFLPLEQYFERRLRRNPAKLSVDNKKQRRKMKGEAQFALSEAEIRRREDLSITTKATTLTVSCVVVGCLVVLTGGLLLLNNYVVSLGSKIAEKSPIAITQTVQNTPETAVSSKVEAEKPSELGVWDKTKNKVKSWKWVQKMLPAEKAPEVKKAPTMAENLSNQLIAILDKLKARFQQLPLVQSIITELSNYLAEGKAEKHLTELVLRKSGGLFAFLGKFVAMFATFLLNILLTFFFFSLLLSKLAGFVNSRSGSDKQVSSYLVRTVFNGKWLPQMSEENLRDGDRIVGEVVNKLRIWLRGYMTMVLIDFCVYTTVFMLLEVPYAPLLGMVAGLGILLPYIGPVSSALLTVLVTLAVGGADTSVMQIAGVIGIYLIHNGVIEQFFIYPAIIGESLGLTTLETIIVVLLGGILAGIPGMIFALPAASVIKYLVPQIYRCWR